MGIIKRESFFSNIEADSKNLTFAILDAFAKDPDPNKVNLCIGGEWNISEFLKKKDWAWWKLLLNLRCFSVYCTEDSQPYILPVVKKTEAKLLASPQNNHEYIPSPGEPRFTKACVEFLLGNDSPAILEGRAHGIQTISGSGALFMGAQFLCQVLNFKRVYLSNPSWGKEWLFIVRFFWLNHNVCNNSQKITNESLHELVLRTSVHIAIGTQKLVQLISMECFLIWKMQLMDRLLCFMLPHTIPQDAIPRHHNGLLLRIQLKYAS